jgi:hypothetical protein
LSWHYNWNKNWDELLPQTTPGLRIDAEFIPMMWVTPKCLEVMRSNIARIRNGRGADGQIRT